MKTKIIIAAYFIIALSLLIGNTASRLQKADWLSHTLFPPFIKSIENFESRKALQKENRGLRQQVAKQTLMILNLQTQVKSIQSTSAIRFNPGNVNFKVAEVIGYTGTFWERNLILNKGKKEGIIQDSPVISADGVVGKVIGVTNHYSIVLPITHNQFRLAVMDKNSSVQGILETDYYGDTYISMIKLGSQISIGDTVVTSNISRIFPKDYPIGKVIKLKETQDNLFLRAQIVPFTMIENLESVFVLINPKEQEYEQEIPSNN